MKILHLVRHAKSSWDNPELSDFKRPLNSRGLRDAPNMGRVLKDKIRSQAFLVSSPAVRAIATARLISEQLEIPTNEIETHQNLYHAEPGAMLYVLSKISDTYGEAVLFGHNPGLTDFCNSLQKNEFVDNIPTAGVVGIGFNIHSWSELSKRPVGEFLYFEFPKKFL